MEELINKLKELEKTSKEGEVKISTELLHATINTLLTYERKTIEIEYRVSILEAKINK